MKCNVQFVVCVLCVVGRTFAHSSGSNCFHECHRLGSHITTCLANTSDCELLLPGEPLKLERNQEDLWVDVSFTQHLRTDCCLTEHVKYLGKLSLAKSHRHNNYFISISDDERKHQQSINSSVLLLSIINFSNRDIGVYDISLIEEDDSDKIKVIFNHTFVLFDRKSVPPSPECTIINEGDGTKYAMTCSLHGYFFPPVIMDVILQGASEDDCPHNQSEEIFPGVRVLTTTVDACDNATFTCIVNQIPWDGFNTADISTSCSVIINATQQTVYFDSDSSLKEFILDIFTSKTILFIVVPIFAVLNVICCAYYVTKSKEEERQTQKIASGKSEIEMDTAFPESRDRVSQHYYSNEQLADIAIDTQVNAECDDLYEYADDT